jgi:hypothetical protein
MSEMKNPQNDEPLAGEVELGADGAEALPRRLERYAKARERAIQMAEYCQDQEQTKEYTLLDGCGNFLLFRNYYTVDKVRLHAARLCRKHLLCPLCAIRRGSKALSAYLDRYQTIKAEKPFLVPYFVTFTVKNGDDLWERFTHLRQNIQRMNKRRTGSRQTSEVRKAEGAVWTYEVTNKGKGWHPHVHAVWLCSTPPDEAKLKAEWENLTGDSFQVKVVPMSGEVDGFLEVFKYALKFGELSLADNWHAYKVLSGENLMASFGCFRGVIVPEALTDEPLDDLPFVEQLYQYLPGAGYSVRNDWARG